MTVDGFRRDVTMFLSFFFFYAMTKLSLDWKTGKIFFTQSLFIHSESAGNTVDYVLENAAGDTCKIAVATITAAVMLLSLAI